MIQVNHQAFATSRRVLHKIVEYNDFTKKQLNDIFDAAVSNSQIYWIGDDEDINEILLKLYNGNESKIEPEIQTKFKSLYNNKLNDTDVLPF